MKTIKIPKLDPDKFTFVFIYRSSVEQTPKAIKFKIHKITIEGVEFPDKTEMVIPGYVEIISNQFSSQPKVAVPNWKINEYLRMFTLDKLRK